MIATHDDFKLPESVLNLYPELATLDDNGSRQVVLAIYSLNRTLQSAWQSQRDLPGRTQNWLPQMLDMIETSMAELRTTKTASMLRQFLRAETRLYAENACQAQIRLRG